MFKAQEFALLARWISESPEESYLRDMLRHIESQFIADTRNDFSCLPDLAGIERQITAFQVRLEALTSDVRVKESEAARAEFRLARATEEMRTLKATAERFARYLP